MGFRGLGFGLAGFCNGQEPYTPNPTLINASQIGQGQLLVGGGGGGGGRCPAKDAGVLARCKISVSACCLHSRESLLSILV